MPRQTNIKKNKNVQPTQQDTFRYSQGLDVVARPVDYVTRVRPKTPNEDYKLLAEGVQSFTRGLADLGKIYGDEQAEAGMLAAARGEALPEESAMNGRFIEGHEIFTGMASVKDLNLALQKQYDELLKEDVDPDTFNTQMSLTVDQFMGGRSNAFIKGVLQGGGDRLEAKYQGAYVQHQQEQLRIKGQENIRGIFETQVEQLLGDSKNADGSYDMERIDKNLRSLWSEMQAVGKPYGLHRNEVSKSLVDFIGPVIYKSGNTKLWGFALEPDESGQRLTHTAVGEDVLRWMNTTDQHRKTMEAEKRRVAQEALEDAQTKIEQTMAGAVMSADPQKLAEAHTLLGQTTNILDGSVTLQYTKALEERVQGIGFGVVTNEAIRDQLMASAISGNLTFGTLWGLHGHLTTQDYDAVFNKMHQVRKERASKRNGQKSRDELAWDKMKSKVEPILGIKDRLGNFKDPHRAGQRVNWGVSFSEEALHKWRNNEIKGLPNPNNKAWPDATEREYLTDYILYYSYKKFPDTRKKFTPAHPDDKKDKAAKMFGTTGGDPFGRLKH
jgi:hypothetical protein